MTTFMRLSAISLACVLALSACNKTEAPAQEAPKAEAATETKTEAPAAPAQEAAPAANLDSSPTVKMMSDVWKMGTLAMINGTHPNLTEEQVSCLMNGTRYAEVGKEEVVKMIGEDGVKLSDEFYATEVGQKVLKFMEQSQLQMQGKPIEGEPVVITDEDKAKMAEFSQTETGKKLEAASAGANAEEMAKKMMEIANEEKARCNIA